MCGLPQQLSHKSFRDSLSRLKHPNEIKVNTNMKPHKYEVSQGILPVISREGCMYSFLKESNPLNTA